MLVAGCRHTLNTTTRIQGRTWTVPSAGNRHRSQAGCHSQSQRTKTAFDAIIAILSYQPTACLPSCVSRSEQLFFYSPASHSPHVRVLPHGGACPEAFALTGQPNSPSRRRSDGFRASCPAPFTRGNGTRNNSKFEILS